MPGLRIKLTAEEYDRLVAAAEAELRPLDWQAEIIIQRELGLRAPLLGAPCQHRWVADVQPDGPMWFFAGDPTESVGSKDVFCARCGVTADDAAVRTAASGS